MKSLFSWKLNTKIFLLLCFHLLLVILFFDNKVDIGGDDSDYIIAAIDFKDGIAYPAWHGAFYPILLAPVIWIFGLSLPVLKAVSVLLTFSSVLILINTFRNRQPDAIIVFMTIVVCFSYSISKYSSTTYSEPLFMFLQSVFVFNFCRLEYDEEEKSKKVNWFLLIMSLFLLTLTRNIGWGALIAVTLFFTKQQQWKKTLTVIFPVLSLHLLLGFYKHYFWHVSGLGIEGQLSRIAYKNFYNPNDGSEDLIGFIIRFWQNSQLYLSKHLPQLMGLLPIESESTSILLTIFFYLLFFISLIKNWKTKSVIFFITLYTGILLAVTFITQQVHWDQQRLILPYLPLIVLILGDLLSPLHTSKHNLLRISANSTLVIIGLLTFSQSIITLKKQFKSAEKNRGNYGDKYEGYPVEWKNYALVSEWTGNNINKEKNVLCRKAGISNIYGKRRFIGLTRYYDSIPAMADTFLLKKKIEYIIVDDLNMPTVRRLTEKFLQVYPLGLKTIYSAGNEHASYLMMVDRSNPTSDKDYFERVQAGIYFYPNESHYYALAADRYAALNNYKNAGRLYQIAQGYAKDTKSRVRLIVNVAICFLRLNDTKNAKQNLELALKLDPMNDQALNFLKIINPTK